MLPYEPQARNALLVYPRFPPSYWGFQYAIELMGKRSAMPPLGLITVAALLSTSREICRRDRTR